ncbi:hypothetical protein RI367_001139 [Sorochytrium milnesiophthora]
MRTNQLPLLSVGLAVAAQLLGLSHALPAADPDAGAKYCAAQATPLVSYNPDKPMNETRYELTQCSPAQQRCFFDSGIALTKPDSSLGVEVMTLYNPSMVKASVNVEVDKTGKTSVVAHLVDYLPSKDGRGGVIQNVTHGPNCERVEAPKKPQPGVAPQQQRQGEYVIKMRDPSLNTDGKTLNRFQIEVGYPPNWMQDMQCYMTIRFFSKAGPNDPEIQHVIVSAKVACPVLSDMAFVQKVRSLEEKPSTLQKKIGNNKKGAFSLTLWPVILSTPANTTNIAAAVPGQQPF